MSILSRDLNRHANRSWRVTSPPTVEPVDVDTLKAIAGIDGTSVDSILEGYIEAAREGTEDYLGKALIEQTITLLMDYWPDSEIELPRPPLISVTGVYTTDEDDIDTEYDLDNYMVITNSFPGKLVLKYGVTAPENTERYSGGYKVIYLVGYGSQASYVPQRIRTAISMWATASFENRRMEAAPPEEVRKLLDSYRLPRIGSQRW